MHCKGGRKKWISIWSDVSKSEDGEVLYQSNYNSRWCRNYHFSTTRKVSATRAAWWKFRGWLRILMKKTNRDWTLVCLLWRPKISEKIFFWFNKSPLCSGYHICLTHRGSAVQARMVTFLWCIAKEDEKSGSVSDQMFRSLKTEKCSTKATTTRDGVEIITLAQLVKFLQLELRDESFAVGCVF